MLLEVCVDSLASARAAIAGGADRLELCSALLAGGLTPYTELLRQIRHESDVAVRCLMRPRAGQPKAAGSPQRLPRPRSVLPDHWCGHALPTGCTERQHPAHCWPVG